MFATSVVYPVDSVGGRLGMILTANPMTQIIEAYRAVLLYGRLPDAGPVRGDAPCSRFCCWRSSWHAFHRAEFTFAENI